MSSAEVAVGATVGTDVGSGAFVAATVGGTGIVVGRATVSVGAVVGTAVGAGGNGCGYGKHSRRKVCRVGPAGCQGQSSKRHGKYHDNWFESVNNQN